jgi:hypothetical protein
MKYPRKFICVQSASYPKEHLSYNEQAQYIASQVKRTPFERMSDLINEKTLEQSIKELKSN